MNRGGRAASCVTLRCATYDAACPPHCTVRVLLVAELV
jgi:hypothetical protein